MVDDQVADYGQLIVDECHHLPAHSFEQVARRTKARFVVGLSATVERKNGHDPIIFMQCGPVRHRVNAKAQAAARPFEHRVFVQPTAFESRRSANRDPRVEFQALYRELIDDDFRHRRICDVVVECVRDGRSPLVLTERSDHLDRLEQQLAASVRHLVVLRAGLGKKRQRAVAEQFAVCAGWSQTAWTIAKTRGSQLQRGDERWVRGTLTLRTSISFMSAKTFS